MKKGPFEEIGRASKYQNKWIRVEEASIIRPDGSHSIFGLVYMRPGSTVLALDDQQRVFLVREYKYAVERETIELISGAIEDGESPVDAALRELREETGYKGRRATYLGVVDPFTTVVSSENHLVLVEDLVLAPLEGDQEDILKPFSVPFAAALAMVEHGEITHGASCVAILRGAQILRTRQDGATRGA